MRPLNPKQIAEWFRAQAKQFNKTADYVEATFKFQNSFQDEEPAITPPAVNGHTTPANTPNVITPSQFEDAVRNGKGRIKDFSVRLNTTQDLLTAMLTPNSRVYIGSAGWLRVNDE